MKEKASGTWRPKSIFWNVFNRGRAWSLQPRIIWQLYRLHYPHWCWSCSQLPPLEDEDCQSWQPYQSKKQRAGHRLPSFSSVRLLTLCPLNHTLLSLPLHPTSTARKSKGITQKITSKILWHRWESLLWEHMRSDYGLFVGHQGQNKVQWGTVSFRLTENMLEDSLTKTPNQLQTTAAWMTTSL